MIPLAVTHDSTRPSTETRLHLAQQPSSNAPFARQKRARLVTVCLNAATPLLLIMTTLTEPEMGQGLGVPMSEDVWLAEALIAAQISLTPLCGFLLARFGAVLLLRLCILGLVVTSIISMAVGFVDSLRSLPVLVGVIFLQGALTAPFAPATQVLIVASHGEDERARGMAVWTAARYFGFLAGSLLAGWIAQSLAWPLIFLPPLLISLAALLWLRNDVSVEKSTSQPLDWRGFALLLTTLVALQVLLNLDRVTGWLITVLQYGSVVITVMGTVLLLRHLQRAPDPIISLQPLRNRWFAAAVALSFGINIFTTGQFEILLLGGAFHVSPEILGLRSALGGLAQIAAVVVTGYWFHRKRLLPFLVCASALLLLGLYGYTWYEPQASSSVILWTRMISGFGMGLSTAVLAVAAFDSLATSQNGQAASLLALASALGTALGLAGLNAVFTSVTRAGLLNEINAYYLVFWVQFIGVALLLPVLLGFRSRSAAATHPAIHRETNTALL